MENKYLPSKVFISRAIVIVVFVLVSFGIYKSIPFIKKSFSNIQKKYATKNLLLKDLVAQDTNANGLADWEESLWGLDPTKDGPENKKIIDDKRKELASGKKSEDGSTTNDNDKMARDLLAIIVSLKETNNLTDEAMDKIGEEVGGKIKTEAIKDIYTDRDIATRGNSKSDMVAYWNDLRKINEKYKNKDIGGELNIISQAMNKKDRQALNAAINIAISYRAFGKDMLAIKVPANIALTHIEMANNYEKTAISLEGMNNIIDDPMSGMKRILQYKTYNDGILNDIDLLNTYFTRNGIIQDN